MRSRQCQYIEKSRQDHLHAIPSLPVYRKRMARFLKGDLPDITDLVNATILRINVLYLWYLEAHLEVHAFLMLFLLSSFMYFSYDWEKNCILSSLYAFSHSNYLFHYISRDNIIILCITGGQWFLFILMVFNLQYLCISSLHDEYK